MNEFVSVGSDTVMPTDRMGSGELIILIVERLAPVFWCFAMEQGNNEAPCISLGDLTPQISRKV